MGVAASGVYVTCPAYALESPRRRAAVQEQAESFAAQIGLPLTLSPLLDRHPGVNRWLPVADRVADLRQAMSHRVIWCCRGGHGCAHVLPALARMKRSRRPPPVLMGFSDVTHLHAHWWRMGWSAGYGTLPASRETDSWRSRSLADVWAGRPMALVPGDGVPGQVLRPGSARGPLFAGCLTILQALAGTPFQPDLRGSILALEDVDEKPYRWDRALTQLSMSGCLHGVRGILVGSAGHQEHPDYSGPSPSEVAADWAARLKVPVVAGLPFGHLDDAWILPNRWMVRMEAAVDGRWSIRLRPDVAG